jgi:hypothetical protein
MVFCKSNISSLSSEVGRKEGQKERKKKEGEEGKD